MKMTGRCTFALTKSSWKSRMRHPGRSVRLLSRNSGTEANSSARKPTDRRRPWSATRTLRSSSITTTVGRASSSETVTCDTLGHDRHGELKDASIWPIWRRPQATPMGFDDRAANREPHPHSFELRCEEGVKYAVHLPWIEPSTRVRDYNQHTVGSVDPR